MNHGEILKALGVSQRTWRHWRQHDSMPPAARIAIQHLTGHVPSWPGFEVAGPWMTTPNGCRVHQEIIGNLDYYAYLQRSIGHLSDWPPAPAKNPGDLTLIDPGRAAALERFGLLTHNERD